MDTIKSPEQILREAFDQIQDQHGIAIKHVDFRLADNSIGFERRYIPTDLTFEATFSTKARK